jgi:hypothetical protein
MGISNILGNLGSGAKSGFNYVSRSLVNITSGDRNGDNVVGTILFLIVCAFVLYYLLGVIGQTLSYGCGRHTPAFVLERFSSEGDSSKKYYSNLSARNNKYSKRIDACRTIIENITANYNGMQADICYITNQVDESIAGNYASNVPEDERLLKPEEQAARAEKRKVNAIKYVNSLKRQFSEANDNTPIVECFDAITPDESMELDNIRAQLNADIDENESSINALEQDTKSLRNQISDKQIAIYYTSLAYNDKYLKELVRQMKKVNEQFVDAPTTEVLTFNAPKSSISSDPTKEPGHRIELMEKKISTIEDTLKTVNKAVQIFVNTIKLQRDQIKQTKAIATDSQLQLTKMNTNIAKIGAKAA